MLYSETNVMESMDNWLLKTIDSGWLENAILLVRDMSYLDTLMNVMWEEVQKKKKVQIHKMSYDEHISLDNVRFHIIWCVNFD